MLGKTALLALFFLGVACYQVTAQDEGTDGEIEYEDPKQAGKRISPPWIQNNCQPRVGNIRISQVFRTRQGRQLCIGLVQRFQHCAGQCRSSFYLNPLTLRPVKRCLCCLPTSQGVSGVNRVVRLRCLTGSPRFRNVRVNLVEARGCACRSC